MRRREDYSDIRVFMRDVVKDAIELLQTDGDLTPNLIYLFQNISYYNIPVFYRLSYEQFAESVLKITPNQFFKRLRVARTCMRYPAIWEAFKKGEITASHVIVMTRHVTQHNVDMILKQLPGTSKREAERILSRVTYDGRLLEHEDRIDVHIQLKKCEWELLQRAREVLRRRRYVPRDREVFVMAVQDLLERRDPTWT